PAGLQLTIEERHEFRRQPPAVNDVVELLDGAHDLEIAVRSHAQTHVNVADDQRGGKAVSRTVGNGKSENIVRDRDEVVEIAADDFGGNRPAPDVESRILRRAPRQDRVLE